MFLNLVQKRILTVAISIMFVNSENVLLICQITMNKIPTRCDNLNSRRAWVDECHREPMKKTKLNYTRWLSCTSLLYNNSIFSSICYAFTQVTSETFYIYA